MEKTILFMDNDLKFLDVHSRLLEQAGYQVIRTSSLQEAEARLKERYIHLAILDIRMEDETDAQDISGLKLLEKEEYRTIPKITLTAYPSWMYAEKALGAALGGLQLTGMIDKAGGPKSLIQVVEQTFTQYVQVNWELVIHWNNPERLSFPHLVTLIEPEVAPERLSLRVSELEDLLRRLFYDSAQINISHLFTQGEGRVFLAIFAYSKRGVEKHYVVSCGQKQAVLNENSLFDEFVPKIIGRESLLKDRTAETVYFAATAYTLTGGDLEEIITFSDLYQLSSIEVVTLALDYLFKTTLEAWYKKGRSEAKKTLNEFFRDWLGIQEESYFQAQVEAICRETLTSGLARLDYSSHQLALHLPDGSTLTYPNPLTYLSETRMSFTAPILYGIAHGRLDGDSILIDPQGRIWLIDFSGVGSGPLVRDFVLLETAIKFDLLPTSLILARHEMEKSLLAVTLLDEEVDPTGLDPQLQKAIQAISYVRRQAAPVIGHDTNVYLSGLLFCAIARLARYDPQVRYTRRELVLYLHSLLSAAMLCQKLTPSSRKDLPLQAIQSLWIDEANKEVWVENRAVRLTPQEFDFLLFLYRRQGRLCSRADIVEYVFGAEYKSQDLSEREKNRLEEARLNSTMSRLRKKVERNPDEPRYIMVIRGEGYKLELPGFSI